MNIRDYFPEYECIKAGDPFLAEIVKGDDIICDHRHNAELLGLEQDEADRIAAEIERLQLAFELCTLDRWWWL